MWTCSKPQIYTDKHLSIKLYRQKSIEKNLLCEPSIINNRSNSNEEDTLRLNIDDTRLSLQSRNISQLNDAIVDDLKCLSFLIKLWVPGNKLPITVARSQSMFIVSNLAVAILEQVLSLIVHKKSDTFKTILAVALFGKISTKMFPQRYPECCEFYFYSSRNFVAIIVPTYCGAACSMLLLCLMMLWLYYNVTFAEAP